MEHNENDIKIFCEFLASFPVVVTNVVDAFNNAYEYM